MSETYQRADAPHCNYRLSPLPGTNLLLRGPVPDLSGPFVAFAGAAQTFGRFCRAPFPALLQPIIGVPTLNLGLGGSGPRQFAKPRLLEVLNRAKLVVLQVLSGRSASNAFFDNATTGNLIGARRSDGRPARFEAVLQELLDQRRRSDVRALVEQSRADYLESFLALIAQIQTPTILFWFSTRNPDFADNFEAREHWNVLGAFPHLVNLDMVDALRAAAGAYVEVVSRDGLPQRLWRAEEATIGTQLEDGWLVNRYYPSEAMHVQAAEALAPACARLMPRRRTSS